MAKSMFNLTDFKASIKSNGVAKDTRFEVVLFPPQQLQINSKEISIRCHTASMPAFNVKTKDYIVGQGQIRKMPVNYDNGNVIEMSFYNNYKGTVYSDLVKWAKMVTIFPAANDHTMNFVSEMYGKINVQQLDERDNVRQGWILYDAYPISVDAIQLDSGHVNSVQLVKIHIAYRYALTLKDVNDAETSAITEKLRVSNTRGDYLSGENTRKVISTASGRYTTRNRSYSPFDTPDPTMVSIVSDTGKGTGLTPDEFSAYLSQFISTTRVKGMGIYTEDQFNWLANDLPNMENVLATNDRLVILNEFGEFTSSYNKIRTRTNMFFGDVTSCVNDYTSLSKMIDPSEQIISDMMELQYVHNSVYKRQVDMDNSFNYISDVVSFFESDVSFSLNEG